MFIFIFSRPPKSEKEIHAEIQAIIRQITASVTFLPILEDACKFI
jgi:mitotic spindle assembly checkpoint protein MAD2